MMRRDDDPFFLDFSRLTRLTYGLDSLDSTTTASPVAGIMTHLVFIPWYGAQLTPGPPDQNIVQADFIIISSRGG